MVRKGSPVRVREWASGSQGRHVVHFRAMLERTARLFMAAGIASLLLAGCTEAKPRRHDRVCSRVISPGHSVEHLVHSLRPGMTGKATIHVEKGK